VGGESQGCTFAADLVRPSGENVVLLRPYRIKGRKKVSQTELNFELIGMPWYPRTALGVRGRRTTDGVDGGQRPDHLCFTPARWTLPPDSPPPSQVRPRGGEPGGSRPVLPRRQSSEQRERDGRKRQWSFLPSVEVGQKYSK
jgi:hypothetical protein